MVIIIGAESMTGKTLMAQKLLEKYRMPFLSIDHLKMGLYRANINCGFKPDDSNEVIEKHLWPILKGIIETNIENNQNMIIEGCYIYPNRIREFAREYKAKIIPIFMGFSKQYLDHNFTTNVLGFQNAIELREEPDERPLEWFIEAHNKMKVLCMESCIRFFEINNNYEKDTAVIYQWIDLEVKRIQGFSQ